MRKYRQLTPAQRYTIYKLKKQDFSIARIAGIISVSASTVYREIKRNSGKRGYRPRQAQAKCLERRHTARKRIRFTEDIQAYVEQKIKQYFSPEQIVGRALKENQEIVSVERIYQHILSDKRAGGQLHLYLRHFNKKKRKRYGSNDKRGQIKNRRFIDERPKIVEQKQRIGDYEIDTMVGRGRKSYLITIVERKSKYTIIGLSKTKHAELVSQEIIKRLRPAKHKVHTLTADNGKEFAQHELIAKALEAEVYFAHPYRSWERAINENTNGLIRQFFPKSYDFSKISNEQIEKVMYLLNNRPRKSMGYKTPVEIFWNETNS